jgi:hypothetical protein
MLAVLALLGGCQAAESRAESSQLALEGSLGQHWTPVDEALKAPIWLGDNDRGALVMPMYRGAAVGLEDYVFTPPDQDCMNARGTLRIDWNRQTNKVRYQLKYKKVPVNPDVHRTEGVDFHTNPIYDRPKDIEDGGYRLWTILTAQSAIKHFYYDAGTRLFVGSEFDFPGGQPPGTIMVPIPVFTLFVTKLMFPRPDGSMFHEYTVSYDNVTNEGGAYAYAFTTYIPLDLCQSNPVQPTLGQLRTWVGPWLSGPPISWLDVLKRGPVFDTTVDENKPFPETNSFPPYVFTGIAFIGNEPVFQGGVPSGWRNNVASVILQVAPGIRPLEGGGNGPNCSSFVVDPHITGPNVCSSAQGGGRP